MDEEFAFSFPLYALFNVFDLPALLVNGLGERFVMIFSDRGTAHTYAARVDLVGDAQLTILANPAQAAEFLSATSAEQVAIDPLPRPPDSFRAMDRLHLVEQLRAMGDAP